MIIVLVLSLWILLTSLSGYAFAQDIGDIGMLQHLGTGGGAVGTMTGGYSVYQSTQTRKETDKIWNKLAALESVDAGVNVHIERLSESLNRLEKAIDHLDRTVRDVEMKFIEIRATLDNRTASMRSQFSHHRGEESSL